MFGALVLARWATGRLGVACLAPAVGWERQGAESGCGRALARATAEDASFLQQMLAVSADWRPNGRLRTDCVIDPAICRIVGFRLATWGPAR